jgi:hypothetical protein
MIEGVGVVDGRVRDKRRRSEASATLQRKERKNCDNCGHVYK